MGGLPTGTVTFLFSDIEGSTRLWAEREQEMRAALATHDALLREVVEGCFGHVVKSTGDGTMAAFASADAALHAAAATQVCLAKACDDGSLAVRLRVRVGVHTGTADERDGDYFGPTVNRAARLMSIGHGGQVLVSNATRELVDGFELVDLGEHRLRDLSRPERVFQLCGAGLHNDFPPLRSLDVLPTNLPVQLTPLVGRDDETATLVRMLAAQRMVTLTGVGGVGKTRLAVHVAGEVFDGDAYPDGVWLVELAPVEPARVIEAIAAELHVDVNSTRAIDASLVDAVRGRRLLVVLDNCEHVLREVRRVVELVLREAPGISVLATSREGLRVSGEQLVPIGSLDDTAAVTLFVERAQSAEPSFVVREGDEPLLGRICERLDGMPLAIELAAARVRMFSLEELARRMEQRFRLLTGGRGGVERHQTLRAAIDWSYDLLDPVTQAVFARLSVFAGGWTLDAAEAVVADNGLVERDVVIDTLGDLVDKSLVLVDREQADTRYGMLETIRQYAEAHLGDSADGVRSRHARWYASFAREAGRGLYSPDERLWLDRLTAEVDNLQVGASWAAASGDLDSAIRLGASFPRQAVERPLLGTGLLAEHALAIPGFDSHPLRARVLAEAAFASIGRGEVDVSRDRLNSAIAAQYDGARFAASVYTAMTTFSFAYPENDPFEISRTGLAAAEAAGDVLGIVGMRINFASIAALSGKFDDALREGQRALDEAQRLAIPTIEASAQFALGEAYVGSDPVRALEILRDAARRNEELGNTQETTASLAMLVVLEAKYGELMNALRALRKLISYRDRMPAPFTANPDPLPFLRLGRPELAALVISWRRRESHMPPLYAQFDAESLQLAHEQYGEEVFAALLAQAQDVPIAEIQRTLASEIDCILADLAPEEAADQGL